MAKRSDPTYPPPRPEVLSFLKKVKENPDDDTPRLIFADWLDEQGDPRGAFVRMSCELEAQGLSGLKLTRRRQQLLRQHRTLWLKPLGKAQDYDVRRGLLVVDYRMAVFLSETMQAVFPTEAWAWVEELRLSETTPKGAVRLATMPQLAGLVALTLAGWNEFDDSTGIGSAGAGALAASPYLKQLIRLDLSDNHIGNDGALALAGSPYLGQLKLLNLDGNYIWGEGETALRRRFGKRVTIGRSDTPF